MSSVNLRHPLVLQFFPHPFGWAKGFNKKLIEPPTDALRPVIPGNVWGTRITAPAGTSLGTPYSWGTFTLCGAQSYSLRKAVYNPQAFFPHAASLRQAFAHCGRFSTAASRRSGARVSVPLLGPMLSHPLPVIGLVGYYPTNYLIGRTPLANRQTCACLYWQPISWHKCFSLTYWGSLKFKIKNSNLKIKIKNLKLLK